MASSPLTRADVLYIAQLARLELSESEVDRFTTDLGAILTYASEIQQVNTSEVAPMSHAAGVGTPAGRPEPLVSWRADEPEPSLDRTEALANAPDAAAGLFRVPKVRG